MKTLIIHPTDPTTDFLKPIYAGLSDSAILPMQTPSKILMALINKSVRVLLMGHGCPAGLFSFGAVQRKIIVVSSFETNVFDGQDENVYIFCNADKYVEANDLHGFYSGMFISEISEAKWMGLTGVTREMVDESNATFAEILSNYIHLSKNELYDNVIIEYSQLAETNPIAAYNVQRLYVR